MLLDLVRSAENKTLPCISRPLVPKHLRKNHNEPLFTKDWIERFFETNEENQRAMVIKRLSETRMKGAEKTILKDAQDLLEGSKYGRAALSSESYASAQTILALAKETGMIKA